MEQKKATLVFDEGQHKLTCEGSWTILTLENVAQRINEGFHSKDKTLTIDGSKVSALDSAGALAILQCSKAIEQQTAKIQITGFSENQQEMIDLVRSKLDIMTYQIPEPKSENILHLIGKESENKLNQINGLVMLIGDISTRFAEAIANWRRFHFPSIVSNINSAGLTALPIVALLSFLIGIVLAYQMGLQLQTYGANIFIAYLSGMALFREFAPLITAIIIAGRTSSAFTAQIGSMKVSEEIDALLTMGLSPTELLVLPKMIGLVLVFPLLIFWSDLFGIMGAMFMSKTMLDVGYVDYLHRLKDSVGVKQLLLGLYKAPAFAIVIALVGCFQGFRVQASADSIGMQTTKSVVQALFLIIIVDAVFSIIYSWMKL